ncbi:MAG: SDR family oxidoreductase [Deltaproteobacteria bacterium]|nr:SDR family oxidoreductase [Deltaproteobacteria bacterium]
MQFKLQNKVIIITGGAGTIGKCFVRGVAEKGGIVVVADINFDAAKSLANEMEHEYMGQIEAAYLDITNKESIVTLIADLKHRYGVIDAVVNNAYPRNKNYGIKLESVTYADFCENVNMHLGGYFLVAQQFCLLFKEQGYGNIVNMSSVYGSIAPRFEVYDGTRMTMPVEYAAIKAGIDHLTRYFAQYYKGTGLRINCLSPGGILAGQSNNFLVAYNKYCSSKGMLDANDLLGALIFLLSDDSCFMTGQNLLIDDGYSL